MTGPFEAVYQRSLNDREGFWGEAAAELSWYRKWDSVFEGDGPTTNRWFVGGECNTCHNAVDRHVADGRGEQVRGLEQVGDEHQAGMPGQGLGRSPGWAPSRVGPRSRMSPANWSGSPRPSTSQDDGP